MSEYIVIFHDEHGNELTRYNFDIWEGNRDKTNRKAIGIAETMYAFVTWQDTEAVEALWFALGNQAEDKLKEIQSLYDWQKGGVTMLYPHLGKKMKCFFTVNPSLGAILAPELEPIYTQPDKAYEWASRRF